MTAQQYICIIIFNWLSYYWVTHTNIVTYTDMTASTNGIVTIPPSRDSEMVDEGRRLQGLPDPQAALRNSLQRNNVVDDGMIATRSATDRYQGSAGASRARSTVCWDYSVCLNLPLYSL